MEEALWHRGMKTPLLSAVHSILQNCRTPSIAEKSLTLLPTNPYLTSIPGQGWGWVCACTQSSSWRLLMFYRGVSCERSYGKTSHHRATLPYHYPAFPASEVICEEQQRGTAVLLSTHIFTDITGEILFHVFKTTYDCQSQRTMKITILGHTKGAFSHKSCLMWQTQQKKRFLLTMEVVNTYTLNLLCKWAVGETAAQRRSRRGRNTEPSRSGHQCMRLEKKSCNIQEPNMSMVQILTRGV